MLSRPSRSTKHYKIHQTKYDHALLAFSINKALQTKCDHNLLAFSINKAQQDKPNQMRSLSPGILEQPNITR